MGGLRLLLENVFHDIRAGIAVGLFLAFAFEHPGDRHAIRNHKRGPIDCALQAGMMMCLYDNVGVSEYDRAGPILAG